MRNLLIMQENDFSGTISMCPSTMQQLSTYVDKLVTSNFQICFSAPYLGLHAKYSHIPNMTRGRTSPGLPYPLIHIIFTVVTLNLPDDSHYIHTPSIKCIFLACHLFLFFLEFFNLALIQFANTELGSLTYYFCWKIKFECYEMCFCDLLP